MDLKPRKSQDREQTVILRCITQWCTSNHAAFHHKVLKVRETYLETISFIEIYTENAPCVLCSITSWVKKYRIGNWLLLQDFFKKMINDDFKAAFNISCFVRQVGSVLANSYPFPPDWTSCCLLFATWQLPRRAQVCFPPVKNKTSRIPLEYA